MAVTINGDGLIQVDGTSTTQGRVRLAEDTDNGTNYVELTAPALVTANRTLTAPDLDGTMALTSVAGGMRYPIQPISASVAGNALTVTLNPTTLDFRSSTLDSGTVNTRTVSSAITMTVSSGSTLGTVNNIASRIVVLAIDNAGTVELAVVNIAGGNQLDETNLISTTAEGGAGAADSNNVIYSTTARSNVAYRVVGFVDSTQTTAGTWATAPSTVQGVGGQALTAMSSLGYGQTWQSVVGSRVLGTTYYNTTGRPIMVSTYVASNTASGIGVTFTVNGVVMARGQATASGYGPSITVVVPPNASYSCQIALFTGSLSIWTELR